MQDIIRKINDKSKDRFTFCAELINEFNLKKVAELVKIGEKWLITDVTDVKTFIDASNKSINISN